MKTIALNCNVIAYLISLISSNIDENPTEIDTTMATTAEDACLFNRTSDSDATLLSIIRDWLQSANEKKEVPDEWCFVDAEKKAIAHFVKVNNSAYYAEVYCLGEPASYLHVEDEYLVMVSFLGEDEFQKLSKNVVNNFLLRDYFPSEKYDGLRRHEPGNQALAFPSNSSHRSDNGDKL